MTSRWYENAPMTILEASALNIISLVPDLGGMKESICKVLGVGSTYVPGDPGSWIQKIRELDVNYTYEIKRLIDQKQKVLNRLSKNNYIQSVKDIYMS